MKRRLLSLLIVLSMLLSSGATLAASLDERELNPPPVNTTNQSEVDKLKPEKATNEEIDYAVGLANDAVEALDGIKVTRENKEDVIALIVKARELVRAAQNLDKNVVFNMYPVEEAEKAVGLINDEIDRVVGLANDAIKAVDGIVVSRENKDQVRAMIARARELVAQAQEIDKYVVFDTYPIEQAEKALAALEDDKDEEDKKAAAYFDKLMSRFKESGEITDNYKAQVKEARRVYDALSEKAKKLVHPANPGKLQRVEARIAEYEGQEALRNAKIAVEEFEAKVSSKERVLELVKNDKLRQSVSASFTPAFNKVQLVNDEEKREELLNRLNKAQDKVIAAGTVNALQKASKDLKEENLNTAKIKLSNAKTNVKNLPDGEIKEALMKLINLEEDKIKKFEDNIQVEKDKKAAENFDKIMTKFKENGKITDEYIANVREARKAYDALSENSKNLVHPANPGKLQRVEARIAEYELEEPIKKARIAVEEFEAKVAMRYQVLRLVADDNLRQSVSASFTPAFNKVQAVKDPVKRQELLDRLNKAQDKVIAAGFVNGLQKAVRDLNEENLSQTQIKLTSAKGNVSALPDGQIKTALMTLVNIEEAKIKFFEARVQFQKDRKALAEFNRLIRRFNEREKITEDYKMRVKEARDAYDALSENAKRWVHPRNLGKLKRAEARIAKYEAEDKFKEAVLAVEEFESKVASREKVLELVTNRDLRQSVSASFTPAFNKVQAVEDEVKREKLLARLNKAHDKVIAAGTVSALQIAAADLSESNLANAKIKLSNAKTNVKNLPDGDIKTALMDLIKLEEDKIKAFEDTEDTVEPLIDKTLKKANIESENVVYTKGRFSLINQEPGLDMAAELPNGIVISKVVPFHGRWEPLQMNPQEKIYVGDEIKVFVYKGNVRGEALSITVTGEGPVRPDFTGLAYGAQMFSFVPSARDTRIAYSTEPFFTIELRGPEKLIKTQVANSLGYVSFDGLTLKSGETYRVRVFDRKGKLVDIIDPSIYLYDNSVNLSQSSITVR